jgi:hypothetical protein
MHPGGVNPTAAPSNQTPPATPRRIFSSPAEMEAAKVWELIIPSCLSAILGNAASPSGVKVAFDRFLENTMGSADPVERLLLEQLYLAHHRLAGLQVQADAQKTPEAVKAYNAAVVRLMGEVRRLALSIKAYRLPPRQTNFSVVHQQNLVHGGEQHVQYVDAGNGKASFIARDKVTDKRPAVEGDLHEFRERIARGEEPAASGCWEEKRAVAAAVDG